MRSFLRFFRLWVSAIGMLSMLALAGAVVGAAMAAVFMSPHRFQIGIGLLVLGAGFIAWQRNEEGGDA